ncbi:hypothetical protein PGB90_000117 [Kerria lacca]
MVLESTMICVDNSDYMRNGDFIPTRMQAQQDAINLVCHSKTRSNPENNVGLISLADRVEVLTTLTTDVGKILAKLHQVQPSGDINFLTGMRIAHLALKHRQGKNHKMRIVAFVGSPVEHDEKEAVKVAKRLKKEKVNVDIVSFGEDAVNATILASFVNTINGKDGTSSHLVTIPPGPHLSDALISSPVIQGEDGTGGAGLGGSGFEFGVDPNEDPELALALRVSMEEQRQRQQEESRRTQTSTDTPASAGPPTSHEVSSDEAMLERALAMSIEDSSSTTATSSSQQEPDFSAMTEDEQIAFALRMSMQDAVAAQSSTTKENEPKEAESSEIKPKEEEMEIDYSNVTDTDFLKSVLEQLPGVENQSGENAPKSNARDDQTKDKDKNKEDKK